MKLNRIPHIYHDTVYAKKIFEIIEEKHIRLASIFKELGNFNNLKASRGILLDILGNNFKIARLGRSDEDYRKIIGFEISSLQFIGNIEEIRRILATYFDESIDSFLINELSGKIVLKIPNTVNKEEVFKLIKKIKTAGVGLNVTFEIYVEDFLVSEIERKILDEVAEIKISRR